MGFGTGLLFFGATIIVKDVLSQNDTSPYVLLSCFKMSNSGTKHQLTISEEGDVIDSCQELCADQKVDKFAVQRVDADSRYVWCECLHSSIVGNTTVSDGDCWYQCGKDKCGGSQQDIELYSMYQDKDECKIRPPVCELQQKCKNLVRNYTCTGCPLGYEQDSEDSSQCIDTDECERDKHNCQPGKCLNNGGSFTCCDEGYESNKISCIDIDECRSTRGRCDQVCTNNLGAYTCSCRNGYLLEGKGTCVDVDECEQDNGGCDEICENTPGSHRCIHDTPEEEEVSSGTRLFRQPGHLIMGITCSIMLATI